MATVTRGTITAAQPPPRERKSAAQHAEESRPGPRPRAAGGDPLAGAARFVAAGARNHTVKVALLPAGEDEADDARTLACLDALRGRYLKFRPAREVGPDGKKAVTRGAYVTADPAVLAWLRGRILAGRLRGVEEDVSMLDIRCPRCEATFKNTAAGHRALGRHVAAEHADGEAA